MDSSVKGVCALCEKYKNLKLSHLMPKHLIKTLLDEHGKMLQVSDGGITKKVQDQGKRRLLCGDCEAHVNKYEKSCSNYMKGTSKRCSPKMLTLYILSVLWRLSYSEGRGLFVNLKFPDLKNLKGIIRENKVPDGMRLMVVDTSHCPYISNIPLQVSYSDIALEVNLITKRFFWVKDSFLTERCEYKPYLLKSKKNEVMRIKEVPIPEDVVWNEVSDIIKNL